jgi:antitoxin component YwqK of YwqJK toxin-antitoxin module
VKKELHTFRCILFMLCMLTLLDSYAQVSSQKKKSTKSEIKQEKIISFEVLDNGDTINKLDVKNRKQGRWIISHEAHYGEEGFHEVGSFVDNIKQGKWNTYTLDGQIISEENFKAGNKDGEAKYYENGYLYCVGNYLALRAKSKYDTILVEDAITEVMKPVVVETSMGSLKHGFWTFYNAPKTTVSKVIEYQADEIIYEKEYLTKTDSTYVNKRMKTWPHVSHKPPPNVWFWDKNKKPAKFTDIPDDTQFVTPNVRRK